MSDHELPGGQDRIDLPKGYAIASDIEGIARVTEAPGEKARSLSGEATLDDALAAAGLRADLEIELPTAPAAARELGRAAPRATVEVPVGPDEGALILEEDEAGGLHWHLPQNEGVRGTIGARAMPTALTFSVDLTPAPAAPAQRGLFGKIGKKLTSFVYKLTDPIVGAVGEKLAAHWEAHHRPYGVRRFGLRDFDQQEPGTEVDPGDWQRLVKGRALLFVHGTFSRAAAFSPVGQSTMEALSSHYDDRIFAFNHPTISQDPKENALTLLSRIPDGMTLDVDIVCHSRGGLVAREIAALGAGTGKMKVAKIIFVGATNAGTALADADNIGGLLDRITTIAKVIPNGTAVAIVDAVVVVLKVLVHAALERLSGLKSMDPDGPFLKALNVPGGPDVELFAMSSDFEPLPGTALFSASRAEDLGADAVFRGAANDLVVPRDGVFAANGAAGFPIGAGNQLVYGHADGVIHTEFFVERRTQEKLVEWLAPQGARAFDAGLARATRAVRTIDALREHALARLLAETRGGATSRALGARETQRELTPEELDAMRPHVVNLSEGQFKTSGIYSTTPADVDAIFNQHIPAWAATLPAGTPLRLVFWAHGGLVGERDGLDIARRQIDWWKRNGAYPIHFVWETGLFDALRSILESVARRIPGLGARDIFDFTTDPIVQEGVRALGGVHVWGAMKRNAQLASEPGAGADYVAQQLAAFAQGNIGRPLELTAVGHSAGAIFHSWFIPATQRHHAPGFRLLQLLAPAIRIDDFQTRLAPIVGAGHTVERAIMYTMKRSLEEADDCIGIYRKSLLYLIHHALEPQRRTPILGLEISVRADAPSATLFGLNGAPKAPGRVVWSKTTASTGDSASQSAHHGDFDDDAPTMGSVATNVLGAANPAPFPPKPQRALGDGWPIADEWLAGVDLTSLGGSPLLLGNLSSGDVPLTPSLRKDDAGQPPPAPEPARIPPRPNAGGGAASVGSGSRPKGGNRSALLIGIDAYPGRNRLHGCVSDTKVWESTLLGFDKGFDIATLTDLQATRSRIIEHLGQLVRGSKAGDVIVFQYSGHGTQVPDLDGDENGQPDQAFVPVDFEDGAFLIDDEVRNILGDVPDGVNLTCFIDCCHSGSITRMLGRAMDEALFDEDKARFLKRPEEGKEWDEWMRAHERFRQNEGAGVVRRRGFGRAPAVLKQSFPWLSFAACQDHEVALESDGRNGDFTRLATPLLARATSGIKHKDFLADILRAFGASRQQTPRLDCASGRDERILLAPLV
jgi:hypothetical protein